MIKSVELKIDTKSFVTYTAGKGDVVKIKECLGNVTVITQNKKGLREKRTYKGYPFSVIK